MSKTKLIFILFLSLSFLFLVGLVVIKTYGEYDIEGFYYAKHIYINNEDKIDDFEQQHIGLLQSGKLLHPRPKGRKLVGVVNHATWKVEYGIWNCKVKFSNTRFKIFDGRYDIEYSGYQKPTKMILESDSIRIVLHKYSIFDNFPRD